MSRKTVVQGVVVVALVLVAVALPAAAQAKLELTPYFGSYYALTSINDNLELDPTLEPFTEKQIPGPSFGARLSYWISSSIGIEGAGAYTSSGTRAVTSDPLCPGCATTFDGGVTTGSVRMLYRPARTNFHLLGGIGMTKRTGDGWTGYNEGLTSFGGVLGFGARAAVTPKLSFDLKVEANLYSFKPEDTDPSDGTNIPYEAKFQTDIIVAVGIPIALMK
jgi:hypothetical protein